MRPVTRAATALVAVAVATATAACSGSGSSSGGKATRQAPTSGSAKGSASAGGPLASFGTVTGTSTSVVLAPAFRTRLATLHVTEKPEGKATLDASTGTLSFPITGGNASFHPEGTAGSTLRGTITHAGSGLTLTAAGNVVTLQNPVLDLGPNGGLSATVLVDGKSLGTAAVTLFEFDTSAAAPSVAGGVATVKDIPVYVAASAAIALNAVLQLTGSNALPTTAHAIAVGQATLVVRGS